MILYTLPNIIQGVYGHIDYRSCELGVFMENDNLCGRWKYIFSDVLCSDMTLYNMI